MICVPFLLFGRHFLAAFDVDETGNLLEALKALWGGAFTVLSFLSTTGFESADWRTARDWSGLGTPGLDSAGSVAGRAGVWPPPQAGVKLLRVYALYLNGRREMERLVHPSSVGRAGAGNRRIRREGAFIAWIFFMLFAISLALVTVVLAALGQDLESADYPVDRCPVHHRPLGQRSCRDPYRFAETGARGQAGDVRRDGSGPDGSTGDYRLV